VLTLEEKSSAATVVAQHLSPKTGPNEMMEVGSTYDLRRLWEIWQEWWA
jgi:hypothetical protein